MCWKNNNSGKSFRWPRRRKNKGFVTEYVSEYAKELVWNGEYEKLNGTLENQKALYEEQNRRIQRLIGKVDFVVTDSPTLLSLTYLKEANQEFEDTISRALKANRNFCLVVQRGKIFEPAGRIHTLEQSLDVRGDLIADREGYSSGEAYWDLKEKLECTEYSALKRKGTEPIH